MALHDPAAVKRGARAPPFRMERCKLQPEHAAPAVAKDKDLAFVEALERPFHELFRIPLKAFGRKQ